MRVHTIIVMIFVLSLFLQPVSVVTEIHDIKSPFSMMKYMDTQCKRNSFQRKNTKEHLG